MACALYEETLVTLKPAEAGQVHAVLEYLRRFGKCALEQVLLALHLPTVDIYTLDDRLQRLHRIFVIWDCIAEIMATTQRMKPFFLHRILQEAVYIEALGIDQSPYAAIMHHMTVLLALCLLEKLHAATRTAMKCLELIERYPAILTRLGDHSEMHTLLDIIALLSDDSARERVRFWRLNELMMDGAEACTTPNLFKYVKRELLVVLPSSFHDVQASAVLQQEHEPTAPVTAEAQNALDDVHFFQSSLMDLEQLIASELLT
jgi:hypothetical protein